MYFSGHTCKAITWFYVTDIGICIDFTLDNMVLHDFISISLIYTNISAFVQKEKEYTQGKTPTTAWGRMPIHVGVFVSWYLAPILRLFWQRIHSLN